MKNQPPKEDISSKEMYYDSLSKALESQIKIIKRAIYPIFFILVIFGILWGFNINSTKNDIERIHKEMLQKEKDVELATKNLDLSTREFNLVANENLDSLIIQFDKFKEDFKKINLEYSKLQNKYQKVLKRNESLYKQLLSDNESLEKFSSTIIKSVDEANKELTDVKVQYLAEINYARKGAEEKKKDIEKVLKNRNEQLEAVQKSTVLLIEYLVLVQSTSNILPNPNIKKGIGILNEILRILIPDPRERSRVVKEINESIK